ncbi:MAG: hypothetical protein M3297_05560 [Thermoproteota archaeon]|nr:hypothetical protein [Thermoproteota archaeon]
MEKINTTKATFGHCTECIRTKRSEDHPCALTKTDVSSVAPTPPTGGKGIFESAILFSPPYQLKGTQVMNEALGVPETIIPRRHII